MHLLILPVSGGGFVTQLAILQHLCELEYIPDLILASSGGNVAAYIAAAANWKWNNIERISGELSQELFVKSWNSITSLSMVIGYFKGDVFNKGNGVNKFMNKYFNENTVKKYEIWTGTYNKNQQKARLFCNRSKDDTILNMKYFDHDLIQTMEPVFTNGNLELISNVGAASASIPALVSPQIIDGEDYIDGGVASASPLTLMQEPIIRYIRENNDSLHMIYVNSIDLSHSNYKQNNNVFDTWKQASHNMVKSQTVIDRLFAHEMLKKNKGEMKRKDGTCNYQNMKEIKELQKNIKYSLLEIYPNGDFDINLINFNGDTIKSAIHIAYKNCKYRFWWIE